MFTTRTKALSATAALFAGALVLTACSGGQSKTDACQIFSDADSALATSVSSAVSDVATDPDTTVSALDTSIADFEEDVADITNEEIKTPTDALVKELKNLSTTVSDATSGDAADMDITAITDASTAVQDAEQDVVDACNG